MLYNKRGEEEGKIGVDDNEIEFSLKHGESIIFERIPNGDGYKMVCENAEGKVDHEDVEIKVINERNMVVPTNVAHVSGITIIVVMIVGIVSYLRKGHRGTKEND